MTEIRAGAGAELAEELRDWIVARQAEGARLFALEGLMDSGKTTLAKEVRALMPTIVRVGLDAFHDPRGRHLLRTWDQAFDSVEALQHLRIMLDRDRTVLVEGAICWPTAELCGAPTKYLYLKRMQFPDFWADQHELSEQLDPDLVLRASIRDSQVARRPWERADLVIERLVGQDGM